MQLLHWCCSRESPTLDEIILHKVREAEHLLQSHRRNGRPGKRIAPLSVYSNMVLALRMPNPMHLRIS